MRRAFTLVELMIVTTIIMLTAVIAIPNLQRVRHNANEAAAKSAIRTISTASETYRVAQSSYPPNLSVLGDAVPPYIDESLADGQRQGYNFTYQRLNTYQYTSTASPTAVGNTGTRTFVVDHTGVIQEITP